MTKPEAPGGKDVQPQPMAEVATGPSLQPGSVQWVRPSQLWWLALILVSVGSGLALLLFPPLYVFVAILVLITLVGLFYYPFIGVPIYLIFEYARLPMMYPALQPLQLGKVIVALSAVAWMISSISTRHYRKVKDRINLLLLAWLLLAFASSLVARDASASIHGGMVLATYLGMYMLIIYLVDSLGKWRWTMGIFLLLHLKLSQFQLRVYAKALAVSGNLDQLIQQGVGVGAQNSFLANATDFGAAMCIVVPFAMFMVRSERSIFLRLAALGGLAAFILSVQRSGSRGAALALLAMLAFYWWKSRHRLALGIASFLVVTGFWLIAPGAWQERFESGLHPTADATASSRLELWKVGINMVVHRPLTGVGLNNFGSTHAAVSGGSAMHCHNIFVQAASELGLPGLALLCAIIYLAFKRNKETRDFSTGIDAQSKYQRNFAMALDLSLIGYLVGGFFLTILYYPHLFIILAFAVSLNQIARQHAREAGEVLGRASTGGGSSGACAASV